MCFILLSEILNLCNPCINAKNTAIGIDNLFQLLLIIHWVTVMVGNWFFLMFLDSGSFPFRLVTDVSLVIQAICFSVHCFELNSIFHIFLYLFLWACSWLAICFYWLSIFCFHSYSQDLKTCRCSRSLLVLWENSWVFLGFRGTCMGLYAGPDW